MTQRNVERPDFESMSLDELRRDAGWFGLVGDYDGSWTKEQLIAEIDKANDWSEPLLGRFYRDGR